MGTLKARGAPQAKKPRKPAIDTSSAPEKHCDDYIDDPEAPQCLRTWLEWARSPAHGMLAPKPHPRLFADYGSKRVRITVASRFGDLGITTHHDQDAGYELRVPVSQLSNFSEEP